MCIRDRFITVNTTNALAIVNKLLDPLLNHVRRDTSIILQKHMVVLGVKTVCGSITEYIFSFEWILHSVVNQSVTICNPCNKWHSTDQHTVFLDKLAVDNIELHWLGLEVLSCPVACKANSKLFHRLILRARAYDFCKIKLTWLRSFLTVFITNLVS